MLEELRTSRIRSGQALPFDFPAGRCRVYSHRSKSIKIYTAVTVRAPASFSAWSSPTGSIQGESVTRYSRPMDRWSTSFKLSSGLLAYPVELGWASYEFRCEGGQSLSVRLESRGWRNTVLLSTMTKASAVVAAFPMLGYTTYWDTSSLVGDLGELALHILASGAVLRATKFWTLWQSYHRGAYRG